MQEKLLLTEVCFVNINFKTTYLIWLNPQDWSGHVSSLLITVKAKGITISIDTLAFRCEPFKHCSTVTISLHWCTIGNFSMLISSFCFSKHLTRNFLIFYVFYQSKNGLELVPQPTYSQGKVPVSTSDAQTAREWDVLVRHQSGYDGVLPRNMEPDDLGRYSPLASRWAWSNGDCFCELNTNYNHLHLLVGSNFIELLCWWSSVWIIVQMHLQY